jgi:hypothetical protein
MFFQWAEHIEIRIDKPHVQIDHRITPFGVLGRPKPTPKNNTTNAAMNSRARFATYEQSGAAGVKPF